MICAGIHRIILTKAVDRDPVIEDVVDVTEDVIEASLIILMRIQV